MTPQELDSFFSRIDLNPEGLDDDTLPEGWRVARPSDFEFVRLSDRYERDAGFVARFRVTGPWANPEDVDDQGSIIPSSSREWLLPDSNSTVIVFRPDEKAVTQGPPKATRWTSWDKACR